MFIENKDITGDLDVIEKERLITKVENLFCSYLPLENKEREVVAYPDEVYIYGERKKIYTNFLNISEIKINNTAVEYKTIGEHNETVLLKCEPVFDPLFSFQIKSGYTKENLPADIKQAMLDVINDWALLEGNPSGTTSITMGPRKITFANSGTKEMIQDILFRYSS